MRQDARRVGRRPFAMVTVVMLSTLACATALPTQATRVVQPEAGRAIELTVGEQIRIDAPDSAHRWWLSGGDNIVTIAPADGDRPTHWILTGREAGEAEIAFEGASESVSPGATGPPAPPRITFSVRVVRF